MGGGPHRRPPPPMEALCGMASHISSPSSSITIIRIPHISQRPEHAVEVATVHERLAIGVPADGAAVKADCGGALDVGDGTPYELGVLRGGSGEFASTLGACVRGYFSRPPAARRGKPASPQISEEIQFTETSNLSWRAAVRFEPYPTYRSNPLTYRSSHAPMSQNGNRARL